MEASRCNVCLGEEGPVFSSPHLPTLLQKHLGIQTEDVSSCEACCQLLNLWDEFSQEARVNLGNSIDSQDAYAGKMQPSLLHKEMKCQSENANTEENLNFTRHFQGICDMCNTTFVNVQTFNDHLNCVHSEHNFILFTNKHIIEDSDENKYNIVEIKKRSTYKNPYNCIYICDNCNKSFDSKKLLAAHIRDDHRKASYVSNLLKKSCDIKDTVKLNTLKRTNTENVTNKSNQVGKVKKVKVDVCENFDYLKEMGMYCCNYCHKASNLEWAIKLHLKNFHQMHFPKMKPESSDAEQESGMSSFPPENLAIDSSNNHPEPSNEKEESKPMNANSSENLENYTCNFCSKVSINDNEFIEHLKEHVRNKIKASAAKKAAEMPLPTVQIINEPKEKKFPCNKCNEKFMHKDELNIHISRSHGNVLEFTCSICFKSFTTRLGLTVHNQVHINIVLPSISSASLKFMCEICGKELASKHGYVLHKKYAHPNHQLSVKTEGEPSKVSLSSEHESIQNKSSVFVCKFCDENLENEFEFTQHLINHVKRI